MLQRFGNPNAIERLCVDLRLKRPDAFSQDWEYEVADTNRIAEFIKAYKENAYGVDEKYLLMCIIVQSMDDVLKRGSSLNNEDWDEVKDLLIKDSGVHAFTVDYWSLWNEEDGDLQEESWFAITAKMREVSNLIRQQESKN